MLIRIAETPSRPEADRPIPLVAQPGADIVAIIEAGDRALALDPPSVMDKALTPPSGDRHDWMNLADYTWPNPHTPDGLPYLNRDGQANPDARRYDRPRFNTMLLSAIRLAAAFTVTGRAEYARKSAQFMATWFTEPATAMNPNLNYVHHVPGADDGRADGVIVFCAPMPSILSVWSLLRKAGYIPDQQHDAFRTWARAFHHWLTTSPLSLAHARFPNNQRSYRDLLLTSLLWFDDRPAEAAQYLQAALRDRLASQIDESGGQPEELTRTLSAQYSLFNLKALMSLAQLGEMLGVDGWRREESDPPIRRAIHFLYRAAVGAADWPYGQIQPPSWWMLQPLGRLANRIYGANFDLTRIPPPQPRMMEPEPYLSLPGWELVYAPSHRQHLPHLPPDES